MNVQLLVSSIEVVYLSFMFHFFRTGIDFNILASPKGYLFEHLIGNEIGLRICLFGQIIIIPLLILLLVRNFISIPPSFIHRILVIAFLLSFMNINALVYLLPVLFIEAFTAFYGYDVLENHVSFV